MFRYTLIHKEIEIKWFSQDCVNRDKDRFSEIISQNFLNS